MMKRTQLYIQEEVHQTIALFAKGRGWSISEVIRKALKEFTEKPEIKKITGKTAKAKKSEFPFADMSGIITSGEPNLSKNIDEIYDED